MIKPIAVQIEIGPKGKKVIAVAPYWSGLSRGAKTSEAALERLETYLPRYAPVAKLAGLESEFDQNGRLEVVEEYQGTGSTDFWAISFGYSSIDKAPMEDEEFERELSLLQAAWTFFDDVRGRVSAEMQRGPRGAAKTREQIVAHTLWAQFDMGWKVGVPGGTIEGLLEQGSIDDYRRRFLEAIREYHAEGKMAKKWPLRFLIRHTAFHTLDHAWEMEDKDLTNVSS